MVSGSGSQRHSCLDSRVTVLNMRTMHQGVVNTIVEPRDEGERGTENGLAGPPESS